ncbi:ATP-binding protein, partial [Patescibacteria group bacterium]|nr:ATP-binding protein [Patescibacteria group bacterium]
MYKRIIKPPKNKSFFLFGPRGTGKTTWLKANFKKAVYLDLLESELYNDLLAHPERLENFIPKNFNDWIIIDEVQRVPALLNEVHRLIESRRLKFILTGSSARKLKNKKEVNLLAGRALTYHFYPLTFLELKNDFSIEHALQYGQLPATFSEPDIKRYLESYVSTYLREEILQEGLTRNLESFSRFLETASFSQGEVLNMSEIARESATHRKVIENYFSILQDMMIGDYLPVFTKRAKRRMILHPKFYFSDVGIYRTLRPQGQLDIPEEIEGVALETFVYQQIKAVNDYLDLDYSLFYWRTANQLEVDFILYGKRGLVAIEVKRTSKPNSKQLKGLEAFLRDYPTTKAYFIYMG